MRFLRTRFNAASAARVGSVWRNRRLVLLWNAQFISLLGDYMFYIAVPWLTLELTGDNAVTGLVVMSIYLPMILFSLVSGTLVDRWDRRRIMLACDAACCALMLMFPLLYYTGHLSVLVIAALAFAVETFVSLFLPARDVLVRELTPRGQLTAANSLVQSAAPMAMILGPALGSTLLAVTGIEHLFTIDALTFAVSFFLLLAIRKTGSGPAQTEARRSVLSDLKEGLQYALGDQVIRWLLIITAVDNLFIMGPSIIGLPIFVREVIGRPSAVFGFALSPAQIYALSLTMFAVGFVAGAYVVNRLPKSLNRGRVLLVGMILDGITFVPLLFFSEPEILLLILLLHGPAAPLIVISRTTMIQEMVPGEMQGRVFSMVNLMVRGMTALSIVATGFLTEIVPVNWVFAMWGALAALTGIYGWSVRGLRESGVRGDEIMDMGEA
jgi:DHA3 family macrolide efflux protein-like MFS transporter